ncbi:MAG TPA: type 1 glutamine amidotransferase [Nocardioides sp.]|uniref:type 1 glutamine amidotransferase n=1 Tax=Nocardioides sp. TaxID=35761 RepID=UPI002F3EFDE3
MTPRVLVIQHEADDPIHLMGTWMQGVELVVCRAYEGDSVPVEMDGLDGVVVMGGAVGAHDDEKAPWLPAVRELIRLAAEARVPTLGICLGHQLCAVALGGEIVVNPRGRQLGLLDVGWTAEAVDDALMGGLVGPRRAMHWNDDVVAVLPEGARQLATSSTGEVQAVRYARAVWGVQWHPEVDDALVARWANDGSLPASEKERVLDDLVRSRNDLDESWRPLAQRFVDLVLAGRLG